jgi:capsular polysaccharide transport system permease protein
MTDRIDNIVNNSQVKAEEEKKAIEAAAKLAREAAAKAAQPAAQVKAPAPAPANAAQEAAAKAAQPAVQVKAPVPAPANAAQEVAFKAAQPAAQVKAPAPAPANAAQEAAAKAAQPAVQVKAPVPAPANAAQEVAVKAAQPAAQVKTPAPAPANAAQEAAAKAAQPAAQVKTPVPAPANAAQEAAVKAAQPAAQVKAPAPAPANAAQEAAAKAAQPAAQVKAPAPAPANAAQEAVAKAAQPAAQVKAPAPASANAAQAAAAKAAQPAAQVKAPAPALANAAQEAAVKAAQPVAQVKAPAPAPANAAQAAAAKAAQPAAQVKAPAPAPANAAQEAAAKAAQPAAQVKTPAPAPANAAQEAAAKAAQHAEKANTPTAAPAKVAQGVVATLAQQDTARASEKATDENSNPSTQGLFARIKSMNWLFILTVVVPTLLSIVYFGLIASDVYISQSSFVVRSPDRQSASPMGVFLKSTGFSSEQDDTYTVQDFILSRDALNSLNDKLGIRKAFSSKEVDIFSRFAGLDWWDNSFEALYLYYLKKIDIQLDAASSITTVTVRSFTAEDSFRINQQLLEMGEALVNQLNELGRQDMIRFAANEVRNAENKAKEAALALSNYRNQKGVINPEAQSTIQLQQIAKLQDELLATQTQLIQLQTFTKNNPQISSLQLRVQSLRQEIEAETNRVAGGDRSLAKKAAEYQRLALDLEFADKQLASTLASLEQARNEAQRKQLYLERIVQPSKPDMAMEPRRVRAVITTFIMGMIAWGVLTILLAGVREHMD